MTSAGGNGIALARSIARTSRPAGSPAETNARVECWTFLHDRGFDVVEQLFEYSTWLGRWGTPRAGVALALVALALATSVRWPSLGALWFLWIALLVAAVTAGEIWLARRGSRRMPRGGVNLVGRRGVPAVWLVAHLDTKGQPVSLFVRAGGVILVAVGWLVTLGGWIVYALGDTGGQTIVFGGLILAFLGALPLMACFVTDRGTGALDNASGIATIFEAVDLLPPDVPIGVLVTTAEELALAGARAWADEVPPAVAINCDGVDDEGEIVCIVSRDPRGRLTRAIEQVRDHADVGVRVRRTLPGVLFDSVALADAGWAAMTVARGTLRSLARVHTAADTLAAWKGSGVAGTAAFVAAVAGAIVGRDDGDHPAEREEQQWSRT